MAAQLHSDQVLPPQGSCDHAEVDGAAKDSRRLSDSFSEGLGLLPAAWRFERIQALRVRAHLNIYTARTVSKVCLAKCRKTHIALVKFFYRSCSTPGGCVWHAVCACACAHRSNAAAKTVSAAFCPTTRSTYASVANNMIVIVMTVLTAAQSAEIHY